MFRDITTLLGNARAFRRAIDELCGLRRGEDRQNRRHRGARFILGRAQMSTGFIPIRKKGKLPTTVRVAYSLEYGSDEMEMHKDAVAPGEKVIVIDDLIATAAPLRAR
jgi:adenine phosphoribosyltransferase